MESNETNLMIENGRKNKEGVKRRLKQDGSKKNDQGVKGKNKLQEYDELNPYTK